MSLTASRSVLVISALSMLAAAETAPVAEAAPEPPPSASPSAPPTAAPSAAPAASPPSASAPSAPAPSAPAPPPPAIAPTGEAATPAGVPSSPPSPTPEPPGPSPKPRSLARDVAPLAIQNADVSVRFGLLLQPQYQSLGETTYTGQGQNLYLRRTRVIVGGTLFGVVDYFFDTDYPNLFLGQAASGTPSVKYVPQFNIQDAFATWRLFGKTRYGDTIMLDAGYMLPPMAHNAVQGAGTLFGWDYFKFTFQHDEAFQTPPLVDDPAARDVGVQLRGLLVGGHLEYRAALFQGLRGAKTTTATGSQNFFRVTGRIQINLLDPETGFFYAGTYLGEKRILSVGGSYDFQNGLDDGYQYWDADAFLDLPVGPGVATAQLDVAHWNGHSFIPQVPIMGQVGVVLEDQTAVMAEAGYTFFCARLSPIGRFEHLHGPSLPTQNRYSGGLAFWPYGHNSNIKAFYTRITQDPTPPPSPAVHATNQFNLQWQIYFF